MLFRINTYSHRQNVYAPGDQLLLVLKGKQVEGEGVDKKRRYLPHWALKGSVYFVTFCLAEGFLNEEEKTIVLEHIKSGANKFYHLFSTVIMPDHVHLLFKPIQPYGLSQIMKGIKGVSARKINLHRQTMGTIWQAESWDRIMRDDKEYSERLNYMANNPVKAELVKEIEEYPYFYYHSE